MPKIVIRKRDPSSDDRVRAAELRAEKAEAQVAEAAISDYAEQRTARDAACTRAEEAEASAAALRLALDAIRGFLESELSPVGMVRIGRLVADHLARYPAAGQALAVEVRALREAASCCREALARVKLFGVLSGAEVMHVDDALAALDRAAAGGAK